MKYKMLFVERDKYYSIGLDEENDTYLMAVIITGIAWYSDTSE